MEVEPCHPDCGPIIGRGFNGLTGESEHAHQNTDGICWHDDEDGLNDEHNA